MSNIRHLPVVHHRPLTGWKLHAERTLAWVLWGPHRRLVDPTFRREWKEGRHTPDGRKPWRITW